MNRSILLWVLVLIVPLVAQATSRPRPFLVFEGGKGAGTGKHIVLIAGDEEYRSEEALPMLARILAKRHGFRCTVLLSQDRETGLIDPNEQTHIPGMDQVATADLVILFLRFRELPDEAMRHFAAYVDAGKPIIGLRTSTHAFQYRRNGDSPFAHYGGRGTRWKGGFGRQILGETWVAHHGGHGSQSTRGVVEEANQAHPILKDFEEVWGPTDVYAVRQLPEDATVLLRGAVLAGMTPESVPVEGEKNTPMMPLVWIRETELDSGTKRRILCSTIGASQDLASAGLRRIIVNGCYWGLGLEERIPARSDVRYVGTYAPTRFGFNQFKRGVTLDDLRIP